MEAKPGRKHQAGTLFSRFTRNQAASIAGNASNVSAVATTSRP